MVVSGITTIFDTVVNCLLYGMIQQQQTRQAAGDRALTRPQNVIVFAAITVTLFVVITAFFAGVGGHPDEPPNGEYTVSYSADAENLTVSTAQVSPAIHASDNGAFLVLWGGEQGGAELIEFGRDTPGIITGGQTIAEVNVSTAQHGDSVRIVYLSPTQTDALTDPDLDPPTESDVTTVTTLSIPPESVGDAEASFSVGV